MAVVRETKRISGSRHSPHARLIANPLAYEVLEAVYQIIPAGTRGGPVVDEDRTLSVELFDYQNWLHTRLPASGLAKGLAGGPDFLPDITQELPPFWRYLARFTAPRNYAQLARLVARNLPWYLGDGTPPVTLVHKLRGVLLPLLLLSALLHASLMCTTGLGGQPWPVQLLVGSLLFILILCASWSYGADTSGKFRANCAELYAYLLAAYAEPGPETENLVRSILEEQGRDTDNSDAALIRRARKHISTGRMME